MSVIRVPEGATLNDGESRTFCFDHRGRQVEAFVLRRQGVFLAFLNECPHWSVELDLGDGHFYDEELDRIYCKNHGALFMLPKGQCETGPCLGRSLTSYSLEVDGNDILVSV